MDKQSKFFDKNYLTTRLRDFPAIKNKSVWFEIGDSNRAFSKTIYIYLYTSKELKAEHAVRISDHPHEQAGQTQFLINPDEFLTKKKKQEFIRIVEHVIKRAKQNTTRYYLKKVSKTIDNDNKNVIE